jgi:hypothetical protein
MNAYYIVIGLIVLVLIYNDWRIEKKQKDTLRELEYEEKYQKIQNMIDTSPDVTGNYDIIANEIEQLLKLKYQNVEKNDVLIRQFENKFDN